ncbi:unnamed protein product, partial [Enterobius vermicularis]|uniref:RNA helicase n=1 Tax=Enterobius vermicularis TaxID=51028 RepID=A0A158QAC4_ENTVE
TFFSKQAEEYKVRSTICYGEDTVDDATFANFNFDERLLKAVAEIGWEKPTQIQQNLIPLILEGQNVSARGRTGSGKTGAFMLPVIQKIIQLTSVSPFALFVTPSKELAAQVFKLLQQLTSTFPFLLSKNYAALDSSDEEERPDLLVSTPGRLLRVLEKCNGFCAEVRCVVLDEADLLLSYGYEEEMKKIKTFLPPHYQAVFTSATLSEDFSVLKTTFANGPVVTLKLKESQLPDNKQLLQYFVNCQSDEERFTVFIALIKLKLLVGKTIGLIVVISRCDVLTFRLGLFLQAFKIWSCILNSNMPVNSRCHIVQEFNEGKYNFVIASDISDMFMAKSLEDEQGGKTVKGKKIDKESGVSRGIDFHQVSNVINFDFPQSTDLYIHRVGRTARGWNTGTALSFVGPKEKEFFEVVHSGLKKQMGHEIIVPYEVRIKELDSFLLRTREALRACTRSVIREARLNEIRQEILRSKKLEGYFIKNPREKIALEHDKKIVLLLLVFFFFFIVPPSLRGGNFKPVQKKTNWLRKRLKSDRPGEQKYKRKMEDPLQSFSV